MHDTDRVAGHTETNVRLPYCALDALAAVMDRRGTSRDETVRQLLAEHVELQETRDPDDRLTHISTVLRYHHRHAGAASREKTGLCDCGPLPACWSGPALSR